MKKYRILSLVLAAAMILAVAAIASSCENNKNPGGVVVDITTEEPTTATTKSTTATQPAQSTKAETTSTPSATTASQVVPTSATAVTAPVSTTAETTPTTPTVPTTPTQSTTEATTTTPAVTPGNIEYDVDDPEFGKLRIKIQNVAPVDPPIGAVLPNWEDVSNINLRTECDLVVKAKIVAMQEVCITVVGNKSYGTVLTLEVERNYYATTNPETAKIRVFCALSSRYTTTDAAKIELGEEYYFFLENVAGNPDNRIGYENICDYFMTLPPTDYYLISVNASTINDSMIALIQQNDSAIYIEPRDNFGFILEEFFA